MLKQTFHFPSWSSAGHCCYKCKCSLDQIRSCSTSFELQQHILQKKNLVSPLMACPGVGLSTFEVDWLHACDLGVGADLFGNLLFLVCKHNSGSTEEQRVASVWRDIKQWYVQNQVANQFQSIAKLMIRKKASSSPKLRGKAAEIRSLIPWAVDITERLFGDADPSSEEGTCRLAAQHLNTGYGQLSTATFNPEILSYACRKFLLLYTALEVHGQESCRWRFKPKFHLWQHLCESTESAPSLYWTYDDEDWGGTVGKMSVRRGGKNQAFTLSANVLTKFRAQNKIPEF